MIDGTIDYDAEGRMWTYFAGMWHCVTDPNVTPVHGSPNNACVVTLTKNLKKQQLNFNL